MIFNVIDFYSFKDNDKILIMIDLNKNIIKTSIYDLDIKKLLFIMFNASNFDNGILTVKYKISESKFTKLILNRDEIYKQISLFFNLGTLSNEINFQFIDLTFPTIDLLFEKIYELIQLKSISYNSNDYKNLVLVSLLGVRGSLDFLTNFFSVDVKRKFSDKYNEYIDKLILLISQVCDMDAINLNFREEQPDFEKGRKRNTQIRIDLFFLNELKGFKEELSKINSYKFDIFYSNKNKIKNKKSNPRISILSKLSIYKDKKYVSENRNKFFNEIQYLIEKKRRDTSIVLEAKKFLPDICFGCNNKYNLENRTFKYRDSDYYYLEINHVIPFSSSEGNVDKFENLVKLCPTCHRALTPNRASEKEQKEIIKNMIEINKKYDLFL
jgi:5-methylcytosine-specific restriction protein A